MAKICSFVAFRAEKAPCGIVTFLSYLEVAKKPKQVKGSTPQDRYTSNYDLFVW